MESLKGVQAITKPRVRINTNSAPRGVGDGSSGLDGQNGSAPHTPGVRINTNSAPRGVSDSSSGLERSNG